MSLETLYQDTYEKQALSQYNGDPRREKSSLGKAALGLAKNMAVMVVAFAGVKIAELFLSSAVGSLLGKISVGGETLKQIVDNTKIGKVILGDKITSNWSSSINAHNVWKKNWAAKKASLQKIRLGDYGKYKEITQRYSHFERDKIADFWKANNLPERLTGKVVESTTDLFKSSTEFYFANQLLGIAGTRENQDKTPWYNVPGKIKEFAKFTMATIPSLLAFRNLGAGFRLTKELGASTIIGGSQLGALGRIGASVLPAIAKRIPNIYGVAGGIGSFFGTMKYAGLSVVTPRPVRSFNTAKQAFIGGYKRALNEQTQSNGFLTGLVRNLEEANLDGKEKLQTFLRTVKGYRGHPKQAFLQRMFNLRPIKMSNEQIHHVVKNSGTKNAEWWEKQLQAVSKKGIPLHDKGVFRSQAGDLVDLRHIDPKRVMDNTLNFLTEHIRLKVGRFNTSIPGLFKVDAISAYRPEYRLLKPGERYYIGRATKMTKGIEQGQNYLKGRGILEVGLDDSGHRELGWFGDGSFFSIVPKIGRPGKNTIVRVTPPKMKFSLVQAGVHDAFYETSARAATFPGKKQIPGLSGIHHFLVNTLDIKSFNHSGVFSWVKGVFGKWFNPNSPLRLKELEHAAVTADTPAARTAYIRTLGQALSKGGSLADKLLRNDVVLKRMGIDPHMANEDLLKALKIETSAIMNMGRNDALGQSLMKQFGVKRLMNAVEGDIDYNAWKRTAKMTADGYNIRGREELLGFLATRKLFNLGASSGSKALRDLTSTLVSHGEITNQQSAALKVWLSRHVYERMMDESGGYYSKELVTDVSNAMRGYMGDVNQTVKQLFTGGFNAILTPFHEYTNSMSMLKPYVNKGGFMALPKQGTSMNFFMPGSEKELSRVDGFFPDLLKRRGVTNSVFSQTIANRSERLFEWFGLGLDPTNYKTGADLFARGILMKRVLPIAAAIGTWDFADKLIDANPITNGTVLDEGITTAIAEQGVKGRILLAHAYDGLGITNAAKYAEGLMPGFIDSPAMRAMRGAVIPLMVGAKLGGTYGGPTGAGIGMLAGAGLGLTQGFGAFDITKTADELNDVYSGREEVPIRRGRWWELCEVKGTKIVTKCMVKNIENVKKDDFVLTSNNKYERVLNKFEYNVQENDKFIKITPYYNEGISCSDNHVIPILRNDKIMEVSAKDIAYDDYVIYPKVFFNRSKKYIKLLDFIKKGNILTEDKKMRSLQYNKRYNDERKVFQISNSSCIPVSINTTYNLGLIIGYYLSEGNIFTTDKRIGGVEFAFHALEDDYIYELTKAIQKVFGINSTVRKRRTENCKVVRIMHTLIGQIFNNWFSGSKYIPEWLYNVTDDSFYRGLLKGFFEGDGYIQRKTAIMVAQSEIHLSILIFIRHLLLNYNILSSLRRKDIKKDEKLFKEYQLSMYGNNSNKFSHFCKLKKTKDRKDVKNVNYGHVKIIDNLSFYKVRKIEKIKYSGKKYDLEIEGQHDYTTISGVVHNSSSAWKGGRIQTYRPNWFARLKSKYKSTPEGLGSPIEQMIFKPAPLIDFNPFAYMLGASNHYSYRHYHSYPHSETGVPFQEFPIIGPSLAATVGRIMSPVRKMHSEELSHNLGIMGFGTSGQNSVSPWINGAVGIGGGDNPLIQGTSELKRTRPISATGVQATIDRQMYNLTEFTGLIGFAGQTMMEKTMGFQRPFEASSRLSNAGDITSFRRAYWDMNLGGGLGSCFVAGTQVTTIQGLKNIEDIAKDDKIISLDGKIHKVVDVLCRKASDLYKLKIENYELIGTSKHHIPIYKNNVLIDTNLQDIKSGDYVVFMNNRQTKFVLVTSVECLDIKNINVYDIQVEGLNYYIANHIVVHNTELWRRLVPRPLSRTGEVNVINPLCNRMPSWMNQKYQTGSPLSETPEGELVLPGKGFESAHDVRFTWPVDADMLGLSVPDATRVMLGLYPKKMRSTESRLDRTNREIQAQANVYDSYSNISGVHDGVIKSGRNRAIQKIKNLSDFDLGHFVGPTEQDISETNFYMREAGIRNAVLKYQWQGRPVLMHPLTYSEKRYDRDMAVMSEARKWAAILYSRGLGFGGEGYSHIDRLDILANASPYSQEYKDELTVVKAQMKAGYDHQDRLEKIQRKRKAMMMKFEFYPKRFKDKVLTPDSEYNNMSLNENIKAGAEYSFSERLAGSIWERLSGADLPFSNKFFPYKDPIEAYQSNMLYGRNLKMWCVKNDTFIITKNKIKKAEDIKKGDFVKGLNGQFYKVKSISINNIKDVNQKMKSIKVWSTSIPQCVTENHSVFTYFNGCIKEKLVKDLKKSDYLVYPLCKFCNNGKFIDVGKYISKSNLKVQNDNIVAYTYLRKGTHKTEYKIAPNGVKIPRFIKKTRELYKLLGYYAAEGGSGTGAVRFSFHLKEVEYHREVEKYMKNIFGILRAKDEISGLGLRMKFHSSVLSNIFYNIFGKNHDEKHLNYDFFNTTKENQLAFIEGYINGDGHYHKNKDQITVVSKRIDLLVLLRDLLLNFSIVSGIRKKRGYDNYILYFQGKHSLKLRKLLNIEHNWVSKKNWAENLYFIENDKLICKIKKIEDIKYNGLVYDFEVDTIHSYSGTSFVIHNSEPADHWFDAYQRGFMSKTTPLQGSIPGAWAGTLIGGPGLGTAVGAIAGSAYGLAHGTYRYLTDSTYIPSSIEKGRSINRYFDKMTYAKNMMLYQASGDPVYLEEAKGTMTGLIPGDKSNKAWSYMYRATPPQEKPYIFSFLQATDSGERDEILQYVPEEVGNMLKTKWNKMDGRSIDATTTKDTMMQLPPPDSAIYAPEVPIEDVKLKTIQKEGLDEHSFGLGFYKQARRVANSPGLPGPVNMANPTGQSKMVYNQNYVELRRTIEIGMERVGVSGSVFITPNMTGNRLMVINA